MAKTETPPVKPKPPILPEPVKPVYIQLDRSWVDPPETKPQTSTQEPHGR